MSFKVSDSYGRIICSSDSDGMSGATEISERIEELIAEDLSEGRPSYYIVSTIDDILAIEGRVIC